MEFYTHLCILDNIHMPISIAVVAILTISIILLIFILNHRSDFGKRFKLKKSAEDKQAPSSEETSHDLWNLINSKDFFHTKNKSPRDKKHSGQPISTIQVKNNINSGDHHVIVSEIISSIRIENISYMDNEKKFLINTRESWISYDELKNLIYGMIFFSVPSDMIQKKKEIKVSTSFGIRECYAILLKEDSLKPTKSKVYLVGKHNNLTYMSYSSSDIPLDFPVSKCELENSNLIEESAQAFKVKDIEDIAIGDNLTQTTQDKLEFKILSSNGALTEGIVQTYNVQISNTDEKHILKRSELLDMLWINFETSDKTSVAVGYNTELIETCLGTVECKKHPFYAEGSSQVCDAYTSDGILVRIQ